MKTIGVSEFKSYIESLLTRPAMYAHDCTSLSEQFHLLYGMWCQCNGISHSFVNEVYEQLSTKHNHGNLFFGSLFTDQHALAQVFKDTLALRHGWEIQDPYKK
ncbi:MAG: hypothetical protein WC761_00860 [Candidatus Paceibacterota bacterium]|jgi:hypothetical protein